MMSGVVTISGHGRQQHGRTAGIDGQRLGWRGYAAVPLVRLERQPASATELARSPGPSLVRGTSRNKGQPRIITDTDPAAHGLSCQLDRGAFCRLQRRGQSRAAARHRGLPTRQLVAEDGLSYGQGRADGATVYPRFVLAGRATSVPFTAVLTGPKRTATDNTAAGVSWVASQVRWKRRGAGVGS
jgi:hypothetical protein